MKIGQLKKIIEPIHDNVEIYCIDADNSIFTSSLTEVEQCALVTSNYKTKFVLAMGYCEDDLEEEGFEDEI